MKKSSLLIACLFTGVLHAEIPEQNYRLAENCERFGRSSEALGLYSKVLHGPDRRWGRRAAFRTATMIRNQHFRAGRAESIRPQIIGLYKSLLSELPEQGASDPELWAAIQRELPWTRLGLEAPKIYL